MTDATRLLSRLLPLLVPLAGCAGSTTDPGSTSAPAGTGGGSQGAGGSSQNAGGAGGTSAQGGTSSAGGSGVGGGSGFVCTGSSPLIPGVDTGFFLCGSSPIHRTAPTACPDKLPISGGICDMDGGPGGCTEAECAATPHGYCAQNSGGGAFICSCHVGCVSDGDCSAGQICLCGENIGACVAATCTKDADCSGGYCSSYTVGGGCSAATQFACTTPQDQCHADSDCKADGGFRVCGHDGTKRVCVDGPLACPGRPLLMADGPRIAELRRRAWG